MQPGCFCLGYLLCLRICNSYNIGKRDLPDMYVQARGSQAQKHGYTMRIRQIPNGYVKTSNIIYHNVTRHVNSHK